MGYRGAIVDLDGTVYRGDRLVPGAERGVRALREAGLDVLFFSNNPTRSPEQFAERLRELGLDVVAGDVLTAADVTREYLRETHPDADAFVVGERGLVDQLTGVSLTDDPREADVLVASIDREFTYATLTDALRAAGRDGVAFVGTDPDRTIPAVDGEFLPGSGAILGAVAAVCGREPDAVCGKPSERAAAAAAERLGTSSEHCLVVGDRLDTDVAMAAEAGMASVLVLSGVARRSDVDAAGHAAPTHVVDSLADVEVVFER